MPQLAETGTLAAVPLKPAVDRKAVAGGAVRILRGEVERQPEDVPRFSGWLEQVISGMRESPKKMLIRGSLWLREDGRHFGRRMSSEKTSR